MTDRFNSLTVVLKEDVREDDAKGIMNAIMHLKGVTSVEGGIASPGDFVAESRVRRELSEKLMQALEG